MITAFLWLSPYHYVSVLRWNLDLEVVQMFFLWLVIWGQGDVMD
jgi:hypothetical protein